VLGAAPCSSCAELALKGSMRPDLAALRVCWRLGSRAGGTESADSVFDPQEPESREPSSRKHGQHGDGKRPPGRGCGPVGGWQRRRWPRRTLRRGDCAGFPSDPPGARPPWMAEQWSAASWRTRQGRLLREFSCRSLAWGPNPQSRQNAQKLLATAGAPAHPVPWPSAGP